MPTDHLWQWTAERIAASVRSREISATEATQSCLARIREVNPAVNALVDISEAEALAAARTADDAVASGDTLGPLHGVPTAIKINMEQAGSATSDGVVAFARDIAAADSPVVANLRAAGAIFVGRCNAPAFSMRWFTENDLHGRTLNPWDTQWTPGGSSGGSAAAVAAGMLPLAHGNDIAGSIRYPSYACGVTGIRPTVGRVPNWTGPADAASPEIPLSVQLMAVQGPIARSVSDLRLALSVMTSLEPNDSSSVPTGPGPQPGRPYRVGVVRDVGVAPAHPHVSAALDKAAAWLSEAGYLVEEVEVPLLAEAHRLWQLLTLPDLHTLKSIMDELADTAAQRAMEYCIEVFTETWGVQVSLTAYTEGWARRGTLIGSLGQFLQDWPILLTPVSAEPPAEQGADVASVDRVRALVAAQWPQFAVPLLGVPALALPTGIADGLPTGVQLIGPRFGEEILFRAATEIENRAGAITPVTPVTDRHQR
ncbi:amidase [Kibdelosporangium banguiense]|uniref:Amidase n=1 Tax=Kibdelosporangium banguiense TaxID=1365924 RepID=A0ABS4TXS7_9PSEU|nr:amidase [Kibdelosporangium banguiense]MBP2329206.1 amidase [Kibdelosporangium banguiense]